MSKAKGQVAKAQNDRVFLLKVNRLPFTTSGSFVGSFFVCLGNPLTGKQVQNAGKQRHVGKQEFSRLRLIGSLLLFL